MILSTTVTLRGAGFPADYPEAARRAILKKRQMTGMGEQIPCPVCKGAPEIRVNCIRCRGTGIVMMATIARINFSDTDDEGRCAAIALTVWSNALGLRPSTVLRISEYGGQLNPEIGNAVVVAGPRGEKLQKRGEARNTEHATFWVERALICDLTRAKDRISGAVKMMEVTKDLQPKATVLYRIKGSLDAVTKEGEHTTEFPKALVEAAIGKTRSAGTSSVYST
jgi:hypothetical protein